jgi:hypothetical protein
VVASFSTWCLEPMRVLAEAEADLARGGYVWER